MVLFSAEMSIFPNCDFIICCFTENLLYLMNGIPWLFMFQWITPWSSKISVSPWPVYLLGWLGMKVLLYHSEHVGGREGERRRKRERKRKNKHTCSLWLAPLARQGTTGLWLIIPCALFSLPFQLSERGKNERIFGVLSEVPDSFPAGHPKCR